MTAVIEMARRKFEQERVRQGRPDLGIPIGFL
jgi:hypothetical protein